jgi:hypothetical protein
VSSRTERRLNFKPYRTEAACPCLADRLGYARLAEPVRFRQPREQAASLRLRDGDTTVLAEYDQHARITGGDPEQIIDAADVALTVEGTSALLMWAVCCRVLYFNEIRRR